MLLLLIRVVTGRREKSRHRVCSLLSLGAGALLIALGACGTDPNVPTTLTLSPDAVSLTALGQTQQLSPTVADQHGNALAEAQVGWSSDNDAVATVGSTGLVTAHGPGSAQVTATAGSATATAPVSVVQAPAQIQKLSGDGQTSTAGQALAAPLVVQVTDALGNPVSGVTVAFTALQGGGTPSPSTATTGSDGKASTTFTSGTGAGTAQISATIATTAISVSFTAIATAGSPASIARSAGNDQHALPGTAVSVAPAVLVEDANGNPVAGVAVVFTIASGGGSVTDGSTTTGADGIARVGSWKLGVSSVSNELLATAAPAGLTGNPVTFTASASAGAFNIEVRFLTAATPAQEAAFSHAQHRWEGLITGDVEDALLQADAGQCGADSPALNETVDDVLILVSLKPIDGPGGILGSAGPCFARDTIGGVKPTSVLGIMQFDTDDLDALEADGSLVDVITHEMGHVLGFGTLWTTEGLLADPSLPPANGTDPHFTGPQAIAAFNAVGGTTYTGGAKVPVENFGGDGTADAHWRESVFDNELMTGFINQGNNPLSRVTVASLADLGYTVNLAASDPYSLGAGLRAARQGRRLHLGNDILRFPIRRARLKNRGAR